MLTVPGSSRGADAGAPIVPAAGPAIQALPRYVDPGVPAPDTAGRERLAQLLESLTGRSESERLEGQRRLREEVDGSWLPAAVERFERLASGADKLALKAELEKVRERARSEIARAQAARDTAGEVVTPEYLDMLVRHPERSSAALVPLTQVVALSRCFETVGTLPAARALVSVYVRFGEFLRVDTQLALERLGDRAVAALIEAKAHPVSRISAWAEKQLGALGKATPADAVAVLDVGVRADVLRAYGKIRDTDSARLLISYSSSESAITRTAARQAIAALGEVGLWPLRDAYEKTVGKRASGEWPWDRVARELFAEFDRVRLAEIYALFNQGREAEARSDLKAAGSAFDRVLARDPEFEHRAELAAFYARLAEHHAEADLPDAILALRRAERLSTDSLLRDRAASLRYTLEARTLFERGIVDEVLMRRAAELDPNNERLAALESDVASATRSTRSTWARYAGAIGIAALAALGLGVVLLRHRRAQKPASPETNP